MFAHVPAGLQLTYFLLSDTLLLAVATSSVLGASATRQDSGHLAQVRNPSWSLTLAAERLSVNCVRCPTEPAPFLCDGHTDGPECYGADSLFAERAHVRLDPELK